MLETAKPVTMGTTGKFQNSNSKKTKLFLDIGCGNGKIPADLKPRFVKLIVGSYLQNHPAD